MKAHPSKGTIRLAAETDLDVAMIHELWEKGATYKILYAPHPGPKTNKKGSKGLTEIFLHEVKEDVSND